MNTSRRAVLTAAVFLLAGFVPRAGAQDSFAETRVAQIDALVHLNPEQRTRIADLYTREAADLQAAASTHRGMADIAHGTAANVRALLTPEQRAIFDRTPQSKGGGLTIAPPEVLVGVLDRQVGLSDAQKAVALKVYQEQFDALAAMSEEDRQANAAPIYQTARDQIRALLTPDQVDKSDAARSRMIARDPNDVAAIDQALRASSALAARVGAITSKRPIGRSMRSTKEGLSGEDRFAVTGESGSAVVTVSWTRWPATSPLSITKITAAQDDVIGP